jgi:hypothetical protein
MSRKRIVVPAALLAAALAAAGVSAGALHRTQSTSSAAATFDAGTVSQQSSRACTSTDGTYLETTATYTGTASSSDPRLSGPLRIRAHSVVNTTTGLGWVEGAFRVRDDGGGVRGTLRAAVAGGRAAGTVEGRAGGPAGKLVASVAGGFTPDHGFASGSLGSTGSANGIGVVFQRGACTNAKHVRTVYVAGLGFRGVPKARATGTFTLDVSRDSNGAVTAATAVFYVNYRFASTLTVQGLAVHDDGGATVLDSGTSAFTDDAGNLTKTVSVPGSIAQALLDQPRRYDVELATSAGTLKAPLRGFAHRR